jgi:tetratricopeptide (TPR) repeat protein
VAQSSENGTFNDALLAGNFDRALSIINQSVETNRAELARLQREYTNQPSPFVDAIGLAEISTGSSILSKAEILTMKGDVQAAESTIAECEEFDKVHPKAGLNWAMTGSQLPVAKAFLLEKKGDLEAAATAYQDTQKQGWGMSSECYGRLAVIALERNDYASAERWSTNALDSDPAAETVFAAVLEKKGETKSAEQHYQTALKLMTDAVGSRNLHVPIFFAERMRAQAGIRRCE